MNMHAPQSVQTQIELDKICSVRENLISPGSSKPSLEITQDTLVGAYILTKNDIKISKHLMNNYMMFLKNYNGKLPDPEFMENGIPYWSGKQLFSLILPNINIVQLKTIKIIHGKIEEGFLNSQSLGNDPAGLTKQIFNQYGMNECVDFLNNTQKLITRWFMDHSFSISFGDSILNKNQRSDVHKIIKQQLNDTFELIKMAQYGTYANDLDDNLKFLKLESDIGDYISKIDKDCGDYIKAFLNKNNNFYVAGDNGAGSKGKLTNLIQIMACVGQQRIWGTRVTNGFTDRTLPHFYRNDIGPDAKGFCRNSYIEGLTPSEMFFHAMGGRCGSIDTAIQTADSGYISRKLIKAAEDLMIHYDMTVRNASSNIIQFTYGDDNMDPTKLEKITKIDLFEKTNEQMEETYKMKDMKRDYFESFMTKEAIDEMMQNNDYQSYLHAEYKEIIDYRNILRNKFFQFTEAIGDVQTYIPVNLFRVIASQRLKFNIKDFSMSDLTPKYIIDEYNKLMQNLVKFLPEKSDNWKLFNIVFKSFLATKRVLYEYRLNKLAFDDLILLMKNKMLEAFISPGEMVGVIGAQTLGEISTQLTLNTFHLAGTGSASVVVTDALPRLKEILRLTKNLKNKNMTIYLKDEYKFNKEKATLVKHKFSFTQIKNLLESIEILYDDKSGNTSQKEDIEFIQSYKEFSELFDIDNTDDDCFSPWILRIKFDKESLMNRNITIQEIQEAIKESSHDDDAIECIFSDDNARDVVMRIRIKEEDTENFLDFIRDFEKQLIEFPLRGISNIEHVEVQDSNIIEYNLDGSLSNVKECILKTNGSNLLEVLGNDSVDASRTYTNDILEFHEIFGIEATRELLYQEIKKVFGGDKVNPRHFQLLADIMCYRGVLMQIERHGLNRNPEIGPIAKASFEEVMNILTQAAVFGERENMKGVSSNILAGQFCKAGTNVFEILIDEEKMLADNDENNQNNGYASEFKAITQEKVEELMNKTFQTKEPDEHIHEDAFNFGFGMENEEEKMLSKKHESKIKIVSNNGESKASIEANIDNMTLDEVLEETNNGDSDLNELTLDEVVDEMTEENENINPKNGEKANDINELELEEVQMENENKDELTLNEETIVVEEAPKKKRGRPPKK